MQNNCRLSGPRTSSSTVAEQVVHTETEDSFPVVNPEVDSEIRSYKVEVKPTTSSGLDSGRFLRFSSWNSLIRALVLLRI